jgi:hypothetical protein
MSLQEQRNKAREQNKHNKAFLDGFNQYLGDDWKLTYKSTTEKCGSARIKRMTIKVECGLYGVMYRLPNIDEVQTFNYYTFGTTLKHFNNYDNPLRKTFLSKFDEYSDVMILKQKLNKELTENKKQERKMKI